MMKFVAKTLYGLETVLAEELAHLGASDIEKVNRAVTFSGRQESALPGKLLLKNSPFSPDECG